MREHLGNSCNNIHIIGVPEEREKEEENSFEEITVEIKCSINKMKHA